MTKGLIRAIGAVLVAIALYSLLGFLILPGIGLRIVNQQLANYATVPARLDRLEFNPFTLELTLWGLQVGEPGKQPVGVSYLINTLQPLPFTTPVVVTLNPAREPDPAKVLAEFDYAHPIFDGPAIVAQQKLADVQGQGGVWLAGAWGSYGFHEDGLKSGLRVANALGVQAPWQGEPLEQPSARRTA